MEAINTVRKDIVVDVQRSLQLGTGNDIYSYFSQENLAEPTVGADAEVKLQASLHKAGELKFSRTLVEEVAQRNRAFIFI